MHTMERLSRVVPTHGAVATSHQRRMLLHVLLALLCPWVGRSWSLVTEFYKLQRESVGTSALVENNGAYYALSTDWEEDKNGMVGRVHHPHHHRYHTIINTTTHVPRPLLPLYLAVCRR